MKRTFVGFRFTQVNHVHLYTIYMCQISIRFYNVVCLLNMIFFLCLNVGLPVKVEVTEATLEENGAPLSECLTSQDHKTRKV